MNDTVGLLSLFIGSFLAATLLPGGSEAELFAILKAYPDMLWYSLIVASIGNTLGGMVTFGMGWLLPQTQQLKYVEKLRRFGTPALIFAWAPLVGDALCLAAGWLRLSPWRALLFMAIGKFARYGLIAMAMTYPLSK
jgi:membrane protein YqaA with SNARE-associated domain